MNRRRDGNRRVDITRWVGHVDDGLGGGWVVPVGLAAVAAAGAAVLAVRLTLSLPGWALALVGLGAFVVALVAAVLMRHWVPRLHRTARRRGLDLRLAVHRRRVRRMSARVLGERWATSAVALAHEPTAAGRARIAARRAEYLSEMERRDPLGFARWMAEDPLGTDPRGYLARQGR